MYVRFVVGRRSENPWWLTGVVAEATILCRRRKLRREESRIVRAVFAWFNDNVPCPPFKKRRASGEWTDDAVSWFRPAARVPIARLRPLIAVVRRHDRTVRTLRAADPGRIVYEDEFQVVAETPPDS